MWNYKTFIFQITKIHDRRDTWLWHDDAYKHFPLVLKLPNESSFHFPLAVVDISPLLPVNYRRVMWPQTLSWFDHPQLHVAFHRCRLLINWAEWAVIWMPIGNWNRRRNRIIIHNSLTPHESYDSGWLTKSIAGPIEPSRCRYSSTCMV